MQAVVTGATGFIGRQLCTLLEKEGHRFSIVGRDPVRARATMPRAEESIAWSDRDGLRRVVERADCVFHLAGESVAGERWTPPYKEKIWASRAETTRRIVETKPRVLVSASAVGYYGGQGDTLLTEDSPPGDDFLARVCVEWEREARRAKVEYRTQVAIVRIGIALGKGGGSLDAMLHPKQVPFSPWKVGLGGPLGNGKHWMPWVHVEDVLSLLLWSANQEGTFNAVSPNPVTNAQFSSALGRALHRPSIVPVPAFALRALVGEFADFLLYSQRVVPQKTQAAGFTFHFDDINAALADATKP